MMVKQLKTASLYIFLGLLVYMPLHIFLSTWLGVSFGVLEFAKVAKDVVLVLGFGLVGLAACRQPWFWAFVKSKITLLILAYAALTVGMAAIHPTDKDAEVLGVVFNLRFLVFLLYGGLLARLFVGAGIERRALALVLGTAVLVLIFAALQYTLLPDDILTYVGYARQHGVLPAFFIDDKPDLERVMSTLRDPNSFGSYTIIIGSLAAAIWLRSRNQAVKMMTGGLFLLSLLGLAFSFSRSAWLGFAAAMAAMVGLTVKQPVRLKKWGIIAVMLAVVGLAGLYAARDHYLVQNIVFHADEATVLETPNELRLRFAQESVVAIADQPLGHGPGTAGLASIRNEVQGTVLNENYYLQIAYEVGLIGLALFLGILWLVGRRLYALSGVSALALGLFAAFAGLFVTNLFVHIWSNEAVAYTWWGLAGLLVFGQIKRSGTSSGDLVDRLDWFIGRGTIGDDALKALAEEDRLQKQLAQKPPPKKDERHKLPRRAGRRS